jgi:hypothetical protein
MEAIDWNKRKGLFLWQVHTRNFLQMPTEKHGPRQGSRSNGILEGALVLPLLLGLILYLLN